MTTANAIVFEKPKQLSLRSVEISEPELGDVVVDMEFSGISTGTERLLWDGDMPSFPGMGYPLVPGYESVGRITSAGADAQSRIGETVFVPGARCYGEIKGLFGGASSKVVVPSGSAIGIDQALKHNDRQHGILIALAATAYHALAADGARAPELIVGHGVLGRLLARMTIATGAPAPVVWETNPDRADGALGYNVIHPDADDRRDYHSIYDVSGDSGLLDTLISRLAPMGEVVLAGFYSAPLSFAFPLAFMKEARMRVAAEWKPADLTKVLDLIERRALSLDGLITHQQTPAQADDAYETAFTNPNCLKMVLDWRDLL